MPFVPFKKGMKKGKKMKKDEKEIPPGIEKAMGSAFAKAGFPKKKK